MHLICCALFAAASALAPPSVSVRASTSTSFKVVHQDSTTVVDDRSFAGDNLPTFCETVATPGVQWCADVASTLAAAPKTFEFLRVSPIMPGKDELKSDVGSGLDEYGEVDPEARGLVDLIKQRNEVHGVGALEQMLEDVPVARFRRQLEYACWYQDVPQGDVNHFLNCLYPAARNAMRQTKDVFAATDAYGGVTHQGTSLGVALMKTQNVLNIPSLVIVPGTLVVCVCSNNLRRDKKNSLLTDNSATCKAIISALSKAYGLAGRAPEVVAALEGWAVPAFDIIDAQLSSKDGVVTYSLNPHRCAINTVPFDQRKAAFQATADLNGDLLRKWKGPMAVVLGGTVAATSHTYLADDILERFRCVERSGHPSLTANCTEKRVVFEAAVASVVAELCFPDDEDVPAELARAASLGMEDPPEGFEIKPGHDGCRLVMSSCTGPSGGRVVAKAVVDAHVAANLVKQGECETLPEALLEAERLRLDLPGLFYKSWSGKPQWLLKGTNEQITRKHLADELSSWLVDNGLEGESCADNEQVWAAFDAIVREYYAVDGLEHEWLSDKRAYYIKGCLGACGPFRIRSIEDARKCSRELGDGGLIGRGLDDLDVSATFFKYATDSSGRSQAERDALPTRTQTREWVSVVPEDSDQTLGSPADLRWAAERTDDMPETKPVGISLTSGPSSNWRLRIAGTHLGCYPSAAQAWAAYPKTADDDSESDDNSTTLDQMRENAMLPPAKRHRS